MLKDDLASIIEKHVWPDKVSYLTDRLQFLIECSGKQLIITEGETAKVYPSSNKCNYLQTFLQDLGIPFSETDDALIIDNG